MQISRIVFPNNVEVSSGSATGNAIQSVKLTMSVNSGTDLTLGSVCSNMLEATIIAGEGFMAETGAEVAFYKGTRCLGLYTLEKPTRPSANRYKITAYDRVSRLDKDLSAWLSGLVGWPYSLDKFAWMVCAQCGLELQTTDFPNKDYMVQQFSAAGVTGRQLMQWVAQITGRFCRATVDGKIELAWYVKNNDITIGPSSAYTFSFYQNTLSYEDYEVARIEKVQVRLTENDVGTVYPDILDGNTYIVSGNHLLSTDTSGALSGVAKALYEHLAEVKYTPGKVVIPYNELISPGDIINVTDRHGRTLEMYVMSYVISGSRITLSCTGNPNRNSASACNEQSFSALNGKVLELETKVEGLRIENRDAKNNAASLALTVDGIQSQVRAQEQSLQKVTEIDQKANQLQVTVQAIQENGTGKVKTQTGYTFDETGLKITRAESNLTNSITDKGMYVIRGENTIMLQADVNGVIARDVTADNYLIIGKHARFEDYADGMGKRTACFYLGG